MSLIILLLILCLSVRSVRATLSRAENGQVLFSYVVPKYAFLGQQQGRIESNLTVLQEEDYALFCQGKATTEALQKYRNKLVVLPEDQVDLTCNGRLGAFAEFSFLEKWCGSVSHTLLRIAAKEPGILAQEHDGTKFEQLKVQYSVLKDCSFFDAKYEKEEQKDLILESLWTHSEIPIVLDIDENNALNFLTSWPVVGLRVLISSCYGCLAIAGIFFIIQRVQNERLNLIIALVLLLVEFHAVSLCVVEAGGMHYMGSFWSLKVVLVFHTTFFGTSVAQNFLLSVVFRQVAASVHGFMDSGTHDRRAFLVGAFCLVTADVSFSIAAASNLQGTVLKLFMFVAPLGFAMLQVLIGIYHYYQTKRAAQALSMIISTVQQVNAAMLEKKMLAKLAFRMRVSLVADFFSTGALFLSAIMFTSIPRLIVAHVTIHMSRIISLAAQLSICRGTQQSRRSVRPSALATASNLRQANRTTGLTMNSTAMSVKPSE